jgi:hypothetical protein
MDSIDIDFSLPFAFTFEWPFPYTATTEQAGRSPAWPQTYGCEEDNHADTTKPTVKTSEACSTSANANSASSKRKCSNHVQHTRDGGGNKKRKTIGRPKNDWTPSRSRKLVRLYLMTDLSIEEIIRVLRTRGFAPR